MPEGGGLGAAITDILIARWVTEFRKELFEVGSESLEVSGSGAGGSAVVGAGLGGGGIEIRERVEGGAAALPLFTEESALRADESESRFENDPLCVDERTDDALDCLSSILVGEDSGGTAGGGPAGGVSR